MEKAIDLDYNRNELEKICKLVLLKRFSKGTHIRNIAIGLGLFMFGLFLLLQDDKQIIKFLLLSNFLIFSLYYFLKDWIRYKKENNRLHDFLDVNDHLQIYKLQYNSERIIQSSLKQDFEILWSNVKNIVTHEQYIYIRENEEKVILIPASFMGEEEYLELNLFLGQIDRRLLDDA